MMDRPLDLSYHRDAQISTKRCKHLGLSGSSLLPSGRCPAGPVMVEIREYLAEIRAIRGVERAIPIPIEDVSRVFLKRCFGERLRARMPHSAPHATLLVWWTLQGEVTLP